CIACYNHYLMQINKTWPDMFNIRLKQNTLDINNKGLDVMKTSRIPAFHNMTVEERRALVAKMHTFSDEEINDLFSTEPLPVETADKMIENVVVTFPLPLGLGLNFLINGKEYVVPMAIEEPSVVASA